MALTGHSDSRQKIRACLAGLVCLFAVGCAPASRQLPVGPVPVAGTLAPEETLGIKVVALRLVAGGTMLDFRYRVVDTEKTMPLLDRTVKPYLIDEASGHKFAIPSSPKIGPMRQITRLPEIGRVYWMFFGNPGHFIQRGNKVTVVVGSIRLEHLTVE